MYSINRSFQKYASKDVSFDDTPDRDYLIDDDWRAPPVSKTILGISENKRFEADDAFSDIYDQYANTEADRIADAARTMRWDETDSITAGYSQALSERTRYASTKADEDEYERAKLEMAYKLDKIRARNPQFVSRTAHYTDATFDDDDSAPLLRGNQHPARSRLPSMYGSCGDGRRGEWGGRNYPYSSTPNLPSQGGAGRGCIDSLQGKRYRMGPLPTPRCSIMRGDTRVANGSRQGITRQSWY